MRITKIITLAMAGLLGLTAFAEIKIQAPAAKKITIISGAKRLISGTAPANTVLTVSCGKIEVKTKSDATGKWKVEFPFDTAGSNLDFTVTGGNDKTGIKADVLDAEKISKVNYARDKKYAVSTHNTKGNVAKQIPSILTDGKTKVFYNQGKTLVDEACWKFKNSGSISITIDMQKKVEVNEVRVHAVFVKGYYGLSAPQDIIIQTSIDGTNWKTFGHWTNPPAEAADGKRGCHFSWQKTTGTEEGRFVKIILKNNKYDKYNQVVSLDEIEILGYKLK